MNYNHPFTTQARLYFAVTPILPGVRGRVMEVPVTPNVPLKEGDVLFKLDPRPFQYMVDQKKAELAEAEQNVKQLKSALDQATAEKERMNAQSRLAQENYDRQQQLFDAKVISKATLDTFARNLETARQSVAAAAAQEESARLAFTSEIGGTNTTVARLQAELDTAEYDLDQTVTHAPGPGFVTQVALRPGVYTVPIPLTPVMVFVNTGPQDTGLVGAFQQNSLQRVSRGDAAEIAFDAVPGQIFHGEVISVLDALAAGQILPSGGVQDFKPGEGRALARIKITDDLSSYQNSAWLGCAGGNPHASLPSHCAASAYPAADEELAELRLHGAARRWRRCWPLTGGKIQRANEPSELAGYRLLTAGAAPTMDRARGAPDDSAAMRPSSLRRVRLKRFSLFPPALAVLVATASAQVPSEQVALPRTSARARFFSCFS